MVQVDPSFPQRVLVTGGAGYIGSVLTEMLLAKGCDVTVLDRFFFGDTLADLRSNQHLIQVRGDIRTCPPELLRGHDAVCDLAALSNDPAGELDPQKTLEINFEGRARIARLAKESGVQRYVLASSCSIYGFQSGLVDETSAINPLTTYAEANARAERATLALTDDGYVVTALRQATVYGMSRRMRFDLAINGMTLSVFARGAVRILRDGSQWRPMIHVRDTCRAFITVLAADQANVKGEIFNVGSDDQNLQVLPLAKRVASAIDRPFEEDWYGDPDTRSYRVSFKKIAERLGYRTLYAPEDGIREIYGALSSGAVCDGPKTRTVEWYKSLLDWYSTTNEVALNGSIL